MMDPGMFSGAGGGPAAPQGGPPPSISIPAAGAGPGSDTQPEKAVQRAIKAWIDASDNPQEHSFAAKLYQQVTQFIAKEHDEAHNAMGLSGVQKSIARANGR